MEYCPLNIHIGEIIYFLKEILLQTPAPNVYEYTEKARYESDLSLTFHKFINYGIQHSLIAGINNVFGNPYRAPCRMTVFTDY